jgi:hypothetical protein
MTIEEFIQQLNRKYPDWQKYSTETLVFAYQLGLPPQECAGMYVESDWEEEWIEAYDRDYEAIDVARYGTTSFDPR